MYKSKQFTTNIFGSIETTRGFGLAVQVDTETVITTKSIHKYLEINILVLFFIINLEFKIK